MKYILALSCPNQPGIVYAVSGFLYLELQADIIEAAQYDDVSTGLFFMRVEFAVPEGGEYTLTELDQRFTPLKEQYGMKVQFADASKPMATIIMASQIGHCLNDLLFRHSSGLLPIQIKGVVSNHDKFEEMVRSYEVPFYHQPVSAETKPQAEARLLEIIEAEKAELVILARYMQILSPALCRQLSGRAINIHHSFLPSFKGARPYNQAHDRGVKLIGATAHYVTPELDEGPIIEQDVQRVDHTMTAETLTALGRDIENVVLARAVKWHAEHRILLNGHKTVVFR